MTRRFFYRVLRYLVDQVTNPAVAYRLVVALGGAGVLTAPETAIRLVGWAMLIGGVVSVLVPSRPRRSDRSVAPTKEE